MMMTLCQKIVTSLSFLGLLANLELSRSRIYQSLQKLKPRTELQNLLHSSRTIALSKGTFLDKKR